MKINNFITQLHLDNNQIGAEGAKSIAEGLKINNSITQLYLHNNQIGDAGAKAISEGLKTNNSLITLYLHDNKIGDEGVKAIGEGLKTNISITQLYLGNNQIGAEEIQEYTQRNLKIAQEYNPQAEALNAQGNVLSNKGEYDKAIEKYNEAMVISKKPLYAKNKVNAKKNYERQQAELLAQIQQEQQKMEEYMIHQQTLIQQTGVSS